ncbi:MAG: AAA family ATPase [Muribaculaceae bacterium]|nr:AAA family ATPase [Muribaculaceae bacterium]
MKNTQIYIPELPLTPDGVEAFLAGPNVEGVGPAYARKIVERFGTGALRVLTETPALAENIPGLGASRVARASESLLALPCSPEVLAFLSSCHIGDTLIERIIDRYGDRTPEVIISDPYSMVEDVWQLSFFTADKAGRALGIPVDDPHRLQGSLVTAVKQYAEEGHLFATPEEALTRAADITGVGEADIRRVLPDAVKSGRLVSSRGGLYLPVFHKAETEGAEKLVQLAAAHPKPVPKEDIPSCTGKGCPYTAEQKEAIRMVLDNPVSILTGGPGSGKTTVLRGVIKAIEKQGEKVVLCAPTGRAAKRMAMLTDHEAMTIHRLLGYTSGRGYNTRLIDADTLVIDETSMMEQVLFNHLLQALRPGTRVVMAGDPDQLPAIGAGDVLRSMMESGTVPTARLDGNFRQSEGSLIASGARAINAGEMPRSKPGSDFMIIPEASVQMIHDRILSLVAEELPSSRSISPADILVVTPQQIGPLGARQLNVDLQSHLNPEGPALVRGSTVMRLDDPVMQTANSRERNVYNGEIGVITDVNTGAQNLTVTFSDGRSSTYQRSELSELTLAYATTVHKLQGSEAPNIIIPVTMAHKPMLYRNLLYTAVSRATNLCVLVGEEEALRYAVGNSPATVRHSHFGERLKTPAGDTPLTREECQKGTGDSKT